MAGPMFGSPAAPSGKLPERDEIEIPAPDKVVEYRRERLLVAGYTNVHASLLAINRNLDLHEAVDMVTVRGCDPDLAFQILS